MFRIAFGKLAWWSINSPVNELLYDVVAILRMPGVELHVRMQA